MDILRSSNEPFSFWIPTVGMPRPRRICETSAMQKEARKSVTSRCARLMFTRCGLFAEEVRVAARVSGRRLSLRPAHSASPPGSRGGKTAPGRQCFWRKGFPRTGSVNLGRLSVARLSFNEDVVSVAFKENIISPMEDSPIPDISGKDGNDGAGTSPRSQGKSFR